MSRLLRIALTWLLALALPAQGYVAQTMRLCGPGPAHHATAAAQPVEHDHAAHDHAAPGAGNSAHHQMADQHEAAAADGESSAHDATSPHGKCSVCASCCSAAALATSAPVLDLMQFSADYAAASFETRSGRTADRLDRPPRSPLA